MIMFVLLNTMQYLQYILWYFVTVCFLEYRVQYDSLPSELSLFLYLKRCLDFSPEDSLAWPRYVGTICNSSLLQFTTGCLLYRIFCNKQCYLFD